MKVAVIGNGNVGKAVFREMQNLRKINELVIVGRNTEACKAEAEDYHDALPLRFDRPNKLIGGGYELAENADILVYCAGPSVTIEDRMSIAEQNINVMKEVFSEVDKYAPNAFVIVVSNPLDVIVTAICKYTGRPANKVIGTGTLLDTARLQKMISEILGISLDNISGYVVGEHGASSVVLNSSVNVLGMGIEEYIERIYDGNIPYLGDELEEDVRDAGFKIFRGKGYTSAGVASAATRIVFEIINDTHKLMPVSVVLNGEYGVDGFAVSVPCLLGKEGAKPINNIKMYESEAEKFKHSLNVIEQACKDARLI